jgi:antirestriction protein
MLAEGIGAFTSQFKKGGMTKKSRKKKLSSKEIEFIEAYADGGKTMDEIWDKHRIADQYEGKKPEEIWLRLTPSQRKHLLLDHANISSGDLSFYVSWSTTFEDLPHFVKQIVKKHFAEGQYAKGGRVSNLSTIEFVFKDTDEKYIKKAYDILELEGIKVDSRKKWHTKGFADELEDENSLVVRFDLNDAKNPEALRRKLKNLEKYNGIDVVFAKEYAKGGGVAKTSDKWKNYVLNNKSWFDDESEDIGGDEILLTTRKNGNVSNEQWGKEDVNEAKKIVKNIKSKFPTTQYRIEQVDEYVYLYLTPNKSEEEIKKGIEANKKQVAKLTTAEQIIQLGYSKEKADKIIDYYSNYPKEYYEKNKDAKSEYNNAFRVLYTSKQEFNSVKFKDLKEVFAYITNPAFANGLFNKANPIIEVVISLYGWDCLRIKYNTNSFPFLPNGETNYSAPRGKTLSVYPFVAENINSSKDLIDNVNKSILDFIKCYEIIVLESEKKFAKGGTTDPKPTAQDILKRLGYSIPQPEETQEEEPKIIRGWVDDEPYYFAKGGMSKDDSPKVYIADLLEYNNGRLVGKWFDLTDYSNGAELMADIQVMLDEQTKKDKHGEVHEEWAVHDYENFPSEFYSEYMGEADFDKLINLINEAEDSNLPFDVIAKAMADLGKDEVSEVVEAYFGSVPASMGNEWRDFAYQYVEDVGGISGVSNADIYFDYESFGSDERINMGGESEEEMGYEDLDDTELGEQLVEEVGGIEALDKSTIEMYFDYEKFGRDLQHDFTSIRGEDGDYYFFNSNFKKGGKLKSKPEPEDDGEYVLSEEEKKIIRGYVDDEPYYFAEGGEVRPKKGFITLIFDGREHKYRAFFVDGKLDEILLPTNSESTLFQYIENEFENWIEDYEGRDVVDMYYSDEAIYSKKGAILGSIEEISNIMVEDNLQTLNLDEDESDLTALWYGNGGEVGEITADEKKKSLKGYPKLKF